MNKRLQLLLFVCFTTVFSFTVQAQTFQISQSFPNKLYVCGQEKFNISIKNTGQNNAFNNLVSINLPAGLEYIPGSAVGATEDNISNLQQPAFKLGIILAGATIQFSVSISASCNAANLLDAGALFPATISFDSELGSTQLITPSIPIETGLLLIDSVQNVIMSGERCDTLFRKIWLKNTRLGPITRIWLEDLHDADYTTQFLNIQELSNTPTALRAQIDANYFTAFGDGDNKLEINESILVTQKIAITDCGVTPHLSNSLLRAGWGCGNDVCRYDSLLTGIQIKTSTKVPDLVFLPAWSYPRDYCGERPNTLRIDIANIGKAEAENVIMMLEVGNATVNGIVPNSFRLVQNGVSTPIQVNSSTNQTLSLCGKNTISMATIIVPLVEAGTEVGLEFDRIYCVDTCTQELPDIVINYFYRKDCPPNGFVSGVEFLRHDPSYFVGSLLKSGTYDCFTDGEEYTYTQELSGAYAKVPGGQLVFEYEFPLGLNWQNCLPAQIGGQTPQVSVNGQKVEIRLNTPLLSESISFPICVKYICQQDMECVDLSTFGDSIVIVGNNCTKVCHNYLKAKAYWKEAPNVDYECAIGSCQEILVSMQALCGANVPGDEDAFQTDTLPTDPGTVYRWGFDALRLNYDEGDLNNDRTADAPQVSFQTPVRRDRFLPGDTMRVSYHLFVESGGGIDTIPNVIWHEIVQSDIGNLPELIDSFDILSGQNIFTNHNLLKYFRRTLRVRYADGSTYSCPIDSTLLGYIDKKFISLNPANVYPDEYIDRLIYQRHGFLLSLPKLVQAGCLPKQTIDAGDSLFIDTDFAFLMNYTPTPLAPTSTSPLLIGFRTATEHGGLKYAWNKYPLKYSQYSGYTIQHEPFLSNIRPCALSTNVKPYRLKLRIARANMFPYEVRPLLRLSTFRQTMPQPLPVHSAQLHYLALQDSVHRLGLTPLPYSISGNTVLVDFNPVFSPSIDEGFVLAASITFDEACNFTRPDSSSNSLSLHSAPGFRPPGDFTHTVFNQLGYYSNTPLIRYSSVDTVLQSADGKFAVNFKLKNNVIPPAAYPWVYVRSASGHSGNYQLYQQPGNQPIPKNGAGVFNLAAIGSLVERNFVLRGEVLSCEPDSIELFYGWSCGPLDSISLAECAIDTVIIRLQTLEPELDLKINEEDNLLPLCTPSEYFNFEVFNAKTGYTLNLSAGVDLPDGLRMVPGSCQYSYPTGAPYTNLADPQVLAGNYHNWELSSLIPALANGLPGVNLVPAANKVLIRFKVVAECGFVANAQAVYNADGQNACGLAANTLNKPGQAILAEGLSTPYGVQIGLLPIGNTANQCSESQQFEVNLNFLGTPGPTDSVYIQLPAGIIYAAGSFQPLQNVGNAQPQLFPGGQIRLHISPAISAGDLLRFRFAVILNDSAGCSGAMMSIQTRIRSEAFCASLGSNCAVYITTGESMYNFQINHPNFEVIASDFTENNGLTQAGISLRNNSNADAFGVRIEAWSDQNGNGQIDAGDVLLNLFSNPDLLPAQATRNYNFNIPSAAGLCNLILRIPGDLNCACDDVLFHPDNIEIEHALFSACAPQVVPLGVTAAPGATYIWKPAPGLSCLNCPMSAFTPDSSFVPGQTLNFTLFETTANCTVTHQYYVRFDAVQAIATADNALICQGDAVVLSANPTGFTYQWSGPGIVNPAQRVQNLNPQSSGVWRLIVLSGACADTTNIAVTVLPDIQTTLASLRTCADMPVVILGQTTATPGTYQLSLEAANGCDSIVTQQLIVIPEIITLETREFCFGDSLMVKDSLFTQSGELCQTATGAQGCDSTHCIRVLERPQVLVPALDTLYGNIGQTITLNGPNGFSDYSWTPGDPACPDCQDLEFVPDSSGLYTFTLGVRDGFGCLGTTVGRVFVFPPCMLNNVQIPNAFTPNGDMINDNFAVVPHEGSEVIGSLIVWNRWGQKIFIGDAATGWDGMHEGKPAPNDVYTYRIEVICDGRPEAVFGNVTLVR